MKRIVRILSLFFLIGSITFIIYQAGVLETYRSELATESVTSESGYIPNNSISEYEKLRLEDIKKWKSEQVKEGIGHGLYIIAFTSATVFISTFFIKKRID